MRSMRKAAFLAVLLSLSLLAAASKITIADPVSVEITDLLPGKVIDLGVVGPGQKLEVVAQTGAGELSRGNETGRGQEADWDVMQVVAAGLPRGWKGQDSLKYESPMKAIVVVGKDAADGKYEFELRTQDDFDGVEPLSFKAGATVSRDVIELRIAGEPVRVDAAGKAVYQLALFNKGSASDVFEVRATGLPKENEATQTVFVPHNSRVKIDFAVNAPESGEYGVVFTATSLSSERISSSAKTTLFVGSSLLTDLKAAARGVLLFPSAAQLVYALLALVGSLI